MKLGHKVYMNWNGRTAHKTELKKLRGMCPSFAALALPFKLRIINVGSFFCRSLLHSIYLYVFWSKRDTIILLVLELKGLIVKFVFSNPFPCSFIIVIIFFIYILSPTTENVKGIFS